MTNQITANEQAHSLRYFQLYQLFSKDQIDSVLNQPQWAAKYPQAIEAWKSSNELQSSQALLPSEVVLAIARECDCIGDLYADADGETLYMVAPGTKPFRFYKDPGGKMVVEDIDNAVQLSTEQAILDYGADAVWLAQEYGKSRRGERDNRFRDNWPPKAAA